jgi:hypothetical protein
VTPRATSAAVMGGVVAGWDKDQTQTPPVLSLSKDCPCLLPIPKKRTALRQAQGRRFSFNKGYFPAAATA